MMFSEEQINRYARHIILPEVGGKGQEKLLDARVLVIGAGGLGSPVSMYLAAAGIGTIGIVDDDLVSLSNLQRQIAHTTDRLDMQKTESARVAISALNPGVTVISHNTRINHRNALKIMDNYDMIADGSDNFDTRFLVNDACHLTKKTLVSAAVQRFDGHLSTFRSGEGGDKPCYRCIFPEKPEDGTMLSCAEAGVLGAIVGTLGCLQAVEILKELLGIGESLSGSLLIVDGLSTDFRKIRVRPDPKCALCSNSATIRDLSIHAV